MENGTARPRVGILGLGPIGQAMAHHVARAGHALAVWDADGPTRAAARSEFERVCATPGQAAATSDVVLISLGALVGGIPGGRTVLPSASYVEDILLSPDGVLAAATAGTVVLEMCAGPPGRTRRLAVAAAARGITLCDAPISGAEAKAKDGTLTIMFGGPATVLERVRPLLELVGKTILHVGPVGSGQILKLINNIIVNLNNAALCEALVLARAAGIEPDAFFEVVNGGAAQSWVSTTKRERIRAGQFHSVDQVDYQADILRQALALGEERGVRLPLAQVCLRQLEAASRAGYGPYDTAILSTREGAWPELEG